MRPPFADEQSKFPESIWADSKTWSYPTTGVEHVLGGLPSDTRLTRVVNDPNTLRHIGLAQSPDQVRGENLGAPKLPCVDHMQYSQVNLLLGQVGSQVGERVG
jgi:hypothetical protein